MGTPLGPGCRTEAAHFRSPVALPPSGCPLVLAGETFLPVVLRGRVAPPGAIAACSRQQGGACGAATRPVAFPAGKGTFGARALIRGPVFVDPGRLLVSCPSPPERPRPRAGGAVNCHPPA